MVVAGGFSNGESIELLPYMRLCYFLPQVFFYGKSLDINPLATDACIPFQGWQRFCTGIKPLRDPGVQYNCRRTLPEKPSVWTEEPF
jgi:hypothetical protein